jgi:hypothetical protein
MNTLPTHRELDADGFPRGSVVRCGQCGYLHRLGDHGGKEWVLSYTLGHRLVDRNAVTQPVTVTPEPPVTVEVTASVTQGVERDEHTVARAAPLPPVEPRRLTPAEKQRAYRERKKQEAA